MHEIENVSARRDREIADDRYGEGTELHETVVTVVGDLDHHTAPLLEECLVVIRGDVSIDCAGLEFVDSQGLRVLVGADARARMTGTRFVVVEPSRALQRLFEITGVDAGLDVQS
jgi:anti-sigma B factor antagonist